MNVASLGVKKSGWASDSDEVVTYTVVHVMAHGSEMFKRMMCCVVYGICIVIVGCPHALSAPVRNWVELHTKPNLGHGTQGGRGKRRKRKGR